MLDLPPECSAGGQGAEGDVGHPWLHLQHPGGLSPNPAQGCCVSRTLRSFAFRIPSGGSAGAKQALDSQPPVGEAAGRSQAPDTRRQRSNGARLATSSPVPGDRGVSCAHPSRLGSRTHVLSAGEPTPNKVRAEPPCPRARLLRADTPVPRCWPALPRADALDLICIVFLLSECIFFPPLPATDFTLNAAEHCCETFPSTTIQKGTAAPGTPQCAPHCSARPHYAPTLLGLPKGSSSARRPAPEPGWQPPFLPVMLPALGGLSPFPPCRKCGGAVPPACAGEAGSRALAAIPTPGACGWASPPKPASNSLRGEQRFVCKCMRLK
eukprot:XP_027320474.1 uncharacterized protein KIAA1522-like isoform X1 [Anas platyrhynchos]